MRLLIILASIILLSIIGIQESFSSAPSMPPGGVKLEISSLPKLNEEFELFIYLVPEKYGDWNYSTDKKIPIKFSITLPDNFKIIDDDFSTGGNYFQILPDNYHVFSTERNIEFPFQTSIKIKPTEPGLGQIIVGADTFYDGRIFLTLTENYSYISDKSNHRVKLASCNQDLNYSFLGLSVIDINSNTIEKNIEIEPVSRNFGGSSEMISNPVTGLTYFYEYYNEIITVIDINSEELIKNIEFPGHKMIRIHDLGVNSETNLIYVANSGRDNINIIAIDGNDYSSFLKIYYINSDDDPDIRSIAINTKTNILYGAAANTLYVIDLETKELLTKIHLGGYDDSSSYFDEVQFDQNTNRIYVLDSGNDEMIYVIDAESLSVLDSFSIEGAFKMKINDKDNKIYVYSHYNDVTLHVIDGNSLSEIKKIKLYDPGYLMDFDSINNKLYFTNMDDSITVIDVDTFEFDIIHNCSQPSDILFDHTNEKLYLLGDSGGDAINQISSSEIPKSSKLSIEEFPHSRNEYLLNENISFKIQEFGEQNISIDSIIIKNLDNDEIVFTFSEFQLTFENNEKILTWNQVDDEGKKIISGNYALLIHGKDVKDNVYVAHKVLSIIDTVQLDELKLLHQNMFSYMDMSFVNDISVSQTPEKTLSVKKQLDFGVLYKDIMCKNDMTLVILDDVRSACVKPTTVDKLIQRGWSIS